MSLEPAASPKLWLNVNGLSLVNVISPMQATSAVNSQVPHLRHAPKSIS